MSDTVIKVENLGKLYRYGQSGFSRHSLREALTDAARSTVHSARSLATWPLRRLNSKPSAVSDQPSANLQSDLPSPRPPRSPETHWVSPRFKPLPVALPNPESSSPSPRPPRSPRFKPLPDALPNPQSGCPPERAIPNLQSAVLSRLTAPTTGKVELKGSVASMSWRR